MGETEEELEPLFDYNRVQPIILSDEESPYSSPLVHADKRQKNSTKKEETQNAPVVVLEDEEDWLPPPPKASPIQGTTSEESAILLELRKKKQELATLASQSVDEVLRVVEESARKELHVTVESAEAVLEQNHEREKIIISIQDMDGVKQFRMYKDDKFEKLFRMYAEKVKGDVEKLVFCFDGDKVLPSTTPDALGLENDDMLEVHSKTR